MFALDVLVLFAIYVVHLLYQSISMCREWGGFISQILLNRYFNWSLKWWSSGRNKWNSSYAHFLKLGDFFHFNDCYVYNGQTYRPWYCKLETPLYAFNYFKFSKWGNIQIWKYFRIAQLANGNYSILEQLVLE